MITPPAAAVAPRTTLRPVALVGAMVVAGIVVGALAASLLGGSVAIPLSRSIGWRLADGFLGTPRFDPATARTTTVVPISVDWLTCAPQNDSWLAPPEVTYTAASVTITIRTTDAFAAVTTCGGGNGGKGDVSVMLDVGIPVAVRLGEPLGGRALFDGGASRPVARPYP